MTKGFSLIEMLVALGLVVFLVGMTVPSYLANNQTQKVTQACAVLKEAFLQARDNALNSKQECIDPRLFRGWRVMTSSNTITTEAVCSTQEYPGGSKAYMFTTTKNIPSGMSILVTIPGVSASDVATYGLMFKAGGLGVYPAYSPASVVTVSAILTGTTNCFTINSSGGII